MRTSLVVNAPVLAGAFTVLLAVAPMSHAQHTLRGVVTDSAGYALPNAEVRIVALGRMARTDTAGNFAIPGVRDRVVDLTIRRIGYQVQFVRVSLMNGEGENLRVTMFAEPMRLAQMEIEAPEKRHPFFVDFDRRRERGLGTYITADQIARLNTSYPSDAFRSLPGMRLIRANGGTVVRFTSAQALRNARGGECQPTIWVDGQAAPGMEIDEIRAGDIHGIEIYRGTSTTPQQFATASSVQCGAIVVWTKRKGGL